MLKSTFSGYNVVDTGLSSFV